jgi:hypothetical protein
MAPANAAPRCSATNTCSWACNLNFAEENGACIDRKSVNCDPNNGNPANSSDVPGMVTITYTTAGGWTAPAKCAWACNNPWTLSGDGMSCLPAVYLFPTANTSGAVGGRAGADDKCTMAGAGFMFPRTRINGFISVTASDEIRDMPAMYGVPTNRPVVGPGGVRIADNWADLLDGNIAVTLRDAGVLPSPGSDFWYSGSNTDGSLAPQNCTNWTASNTLGDARYGRNFETGGNWISTGNAVCGSYKLVCVGFTP